MLKILIFFLCFSSPSFAGVRWQTTDRLFVGGEGAEIAKEEKFSQVVLLWGSLDVFGEVENITQVSGSLRFHPGSRLTKSLVVMGGDFENKGGQIIPPNQVEFRTPTFWWNFFLRALGLADFALTAYFFWVLGFLLILCFWGFGLFLFFLFPALLKAVGQNLFREFVANYLGGILGFFASPILIALFLISVVGILFLPFLFLAFAFCFLLSYLGAAAWAGHRFLPPQRGQALNPWGFLLGLLAFQLLWFSSVRSVWLVVFVLWFLSWGKLVRSLLRFR